MRSRILAAVLLPFASLIFFALAHANAISAADVPDWGMVQGNARHDGYQPVALDPANFSGRWKVTYEAVASGAATGGGKVFIVSGWNLIALDAATGKEVWAHYVDDANWTSAPSCANGLVYVHTGGQRDTAFWAFDAKTGKQVFRGAHSGQWPKYSAPTICGERAFVNAGSHGVVQAFDALTVASLWASTAEMEDKWEPAANAEHVFLVHGELRALRPATGAIQFMVDAQLPAETQTPVLGSRNDVILSGPSLWRIDIAKRAVTWKVVAIGGDFGMPAVGNGMVFALQRGTLVAFSESSGERKWMWEPPAPSDGLTSNIVVTASHVFVGNVTTTYAIDLIARQAV